MPDDLPKSQMEKDGGEAPAVVSVNVIPAVAYVWRKGWLQTAWHKITRKRGTKR